MGNKHDRILHARVSGDLYDKISSRAKKHRVTISNLIRNVVEDYLEIHNEVLDLVDDKIKRYLGEKDRLLGYQQITLENRRNCESCGEKIKKGEDVFMGFFESSSQKVVICQKCRQEKRKK